MSDVSFFTIARAVPLMRLGMLLHPSRTAASGGLYRLRISGAAAPELSADHIGQKPEEPRPFDRLGQFPLLLSRDGGDARGHDLAAFRNVAGEKPRILVIDLRRDRKSV